MLGAVNPTPTHLRLLHIRAILARAGGDAVKFGRAQFGGLTVTAVGAVLLFFAKQVGWAITLAVLSYPISVVPAFLVYLARDLLGGGKSRWTGEVGLLNTVPERGERLFLVGDNAPWEWPQGLMCVVSGPGGLVSRILRTDREGGWAFPGDFPEFTTPGRGEVSRRLAGGDAAGGWWELESLVSSCTKKAGRCRRDAPPKGIRGTLLPPPRRPCASWREPARPDRPEGSPARRALRQRRTSRGRPFSGLRLSAAVRVRRHL